MIARCVPSVLVLSAALAQGPDLASVRAAEARRVEAIAQCAPAVCSVMDRSAPGGGSGVIFDPRGYVLTNYHVIGAPDTNAKVDKNEVLPAPPEPPADVVAKWRADNAVADDAAQKAFVVAWQDEWKKQNWPVGKQHWRNKKVGLPDGELYEAVVLGVDPGSDLAVLRLVGKTEGQQWPWRPLGDSDALLVGQTVFAMGNPFLLATDFTPTVTFGVVSGTHRYQEGQGNRMLVYPDCIQVDAPINPGNSGGPLFNEAGEVVGINGRISLGDRGRVNVGVGFAIASNQVRNFLPDLMAGRHAEHGTLDMSAWFMKAKTGNEDRHGVFVQQLFKDSVAALAGIALGDEIVRFDGEDVRSANQLASRIGVLPAGSWVEVGYRSVDENNTFGPPRYADIKLAPLDTGSSIDARADGERLASPVERRIATKALRATLASRWQENDRRPPSRTVTFALVDASGATWSLVRDLQHSSIRIEQGGRVIVDAPSLDALPADDAALAQRHIRCNPFAWIGCDFGERLDEGLLVGGARVLGKPAYRFAFPGDGELEALIFEDGAPAGFAMRDPVRKQKVEFHCDGAQARWILDGQCVRGWKVVDSKHDTDIDRSSFRRPQ